MQQVDNLVRLGRKLETSGDLEETIFRAEGKNPWFVTSFVRHAFDSIINELLDERKLLGWYTPYKAPPANKTIGLIFAGNIPLVGFHDFLCCYVAGTKMKIKLSASDDVLFPFVLQKLSGIDASVKDRVELVDTLKGFDAVIATGSNNTNRYFEYYFRPYPKILRKNRNSVAILTGHESAEDLEKLADDIFLYFGFGCRNVSKIYLPIGYDVSRLFPVFEKNYSWLHKHNKYMSNYDYNRTLMVLNKTAHLSNEFVMLVENSALSSPIATLNYETWHDKSVLATQLRQQADQIQCIVTQNPAEWEFPTIPFGKSQRASLSDYADGADTMKFLESLSN